MLVYAIFLNSTTNFSFISLYKHLIYKDRYEWVTNYFYKISKRDDICSTNIIPKAMLLLGWVTRLIFYPSRYQAEFHYHRVLIDIESQPY